MNSQSNTLERVFTKSGIPHRVLGGLRFYDRKEIRDMVAYLSVVSNPNDQGCCASSMPEAFHRR